MQQNAMPSPLEVLMFTMHDHWNNDRRDQAVKLAQVAAPYVHPRAVALPGRATSNLSDPELVQWIADDDADDTPNRV